MTHAGPEYSVYADTILVHNAIYALSVGIVRHACTIDSRDRFGFTEYSHAYYEEMPVFYRSEAQLAITMLEEVQAAFDQSVPLKRIPTVSFFHADRMYGQPRIFMSFTHDNFNYQMSCIIGDEVNVFLALQKSVQGLRGVLYDIHFSSTRNRQMHAPGDFLDFMFRTQL